MPHSLHIDPASGTAAKDPWGPLDALLRALRPSPALELERIDIDHFQPSESNAWAVSVPLVFATTPIIRAKLNLPGVTLSLMRTFPRVVRGYRLPDDLLVVVPMDDVSSARINGEAIGSSIVVLKGSPDCVGYEPQGRVVAIIRLRRQDARESWMNLKDGCHLIDPPPASLFWLRRLILTAVDTAAKQPELFVSAGVDRTIAGSLVSMLRPLIGLPPRNARVHPSLGKYRSIVRRMEDAVRQNPEGTYHLTDLARHVGVPVRTLQNASKTICGQSPRRYAHILRLWSVRRQLLLGDAGVIVKTVAMTQGFRHLGEFSAAYKAAFGEMPSETLARARYKSRRMAGVS